MLDRKTKDYEASDELLEDRIKQSKIFGAMYMFLWLFFYLVFAWMTVQIINFDYANAEPSSLWKILFITITASIFLIITTTYLLIQSKDYDDNQRYYRLLLFLRKQEKK